MGSIVTGWHYANVFNEQVNPNKPKQNRWTHQSHVVGHTDKYATSSYTLKKTGKTKKGDPIFTVISPYTVTAHDFKLNLPSNAVITKIEIQASVKVSKKNTGAEFPSALMCIYGGGWSNRIDNTKNRETGWHNGLYFINPDKKMSTSFTNFSYTIDEKNTEKGKFKPSDLNKQGMGVDLVFDDTGVSKEVEVYIRWVRIRVAYEMPEYTLTHDGVDTSQSKPRKITTGKQGTVKFTLSNKTRSDGGKRKLKLTYPYGTHIDSVSVSKGSYSNGEWTVNCGTKSSAVMTVKYTDYTVDTQQIKLSSIENTIEDLKDGFNVSKSFYYMSGFGGVDDYTQMTTQLITTPVHKRHDTCFAVQGRAESSRDTTLTCRLNPSFSFFDLSVELDPYNSSDGVTITNYTQEGVITFTVPEIGQIYDFAFRFCLKPTSTGQSTISPRFDGGTEGNTLSFNILEPYEYHFGRKSVFKETPTYQANYRLNGEYIRFANHRIASELETGAYVLPCKVKDSDSVMVQGKPNIHMYKWEQLDYIGCVPLEHLHFDPKSTYKDKLLDSHYKNKRYMGKELASDEDITLNVRLHPKQVTTIQGLIDMDKPIPINANHRLFEGDSLNHRGWAEIYGITTTLTNPHWYKCDIDVKYLTHNLNTRFKINKGDKTFSKYSFPQVLLESVESGTALQDSETAQDYFIVDTDGGYIYNGEEIEVDNYLDDDGKIVFYLTGESREDVERIYRDYGEENVNIIHGETDDDFTVLLDSIEEEGYTILFAEKGQPIRVDTTAYTNANQRNIFTLDEGQHFTIQSREPVSNISQITLDWSTSKLSENKENAISKIIRLKNKTDNITIFEYEYSDFDFSEYEEGDAQISCHVIGRAYRKGDYDEVINEDIYIPLILDDDDSDVEDETVEEYCGSTVTFQLNNHSLNVIDTGYTGKELSRENISLEGESYIYEVEWINMNTDGESNDITTFIDLSVQDSVLSSKYSEQYGDMLVSPFPVANKQMIFSRNAEEGVIYYYKNDKEEFSYLIEPYYQYHNGVDLRASPDNTGDYISIFNLNYGYKTVYLENGLVSLGINRLNGQMYLRKWDDESKTYITLNTLQLSNYDDVNINSISDDCIELQASNTLISMYRGHPYVIFKHRLEDIQILNKFGRIWSEQVNDKSQPYPTYFDLLNTDNLLPECVGGTKGIDDECVTVFECGDTVDCPDLTDVCIHTGLDDDIVIDEETELKLAYSVIEGDIISYRVNNVEKATSVFPNLLDTVTGVGEDETVYYYVDNQLIGSAKNSNLIKNVCDLNITYGLRSGDIVYFLIDGDVLDDKPMTYPTPVKYTFDDDKEHEISAVYVGNEYKSFAVAPTVTIGIKQPVLPPEPPSPTPTPESDCEAKNPKTGKYKLTMSCPKNFTYRDNQEVTFKLTRGGLPVCHKTIEMVNFKNISSEGTTAKGIVNFKNNRSDSHPDKYRLGARFFDYENGKKLVATVFKDVKVSKAKTFITCHKAESVGGRLRFSLFVEYNINGKRTTKPLKNRKLTVYINGAKKTAKTNENGQVGWTIKKSGNMTYKCSFAGDTNYEKSSGNWKEKVKK